MSKTLEQRVEQLEKRVAELSETRVVTVHLKADEFITALERMIKEIMAAINEVNEKKAAELKKVVRPGGTRFKSSNSVGRRAD